MTSSTSFQPPLERNGSLLHEPFLARASQLDEANLGRHALGAFLTLRLADRFAPDGDKPHPMALAYQTRATRDYLLDLHPKTPEVTHLLEVIRLAEAVQKDAARSLLWPPLLAYAYWLEQELRLAEALDVVETALGLDDGAACTEEIAALLQRGRILRLLGRLDEARRAYEAGRARAVATGDMHSALLGSIGGAKVMQQVGNLSGADCALRGILVEAETLGDRDAQARAHHDLGAVLVHRDNARQAVLDLYRAFELYDEPGNKLRALSDVGEAMKREGHHAAAEDAFELVLQGKPDTQVRATTMIALLEVSAVRRNRLAFARWSKEIAGLSDELPAERRVDFEFQLGLGHAAFGHAAKAVGCLRSALAQAEQYHMNEYVFRVQQALENVQKNSARDRAESPAPSRAEGAAELAEVVGKLHALREG